MGRPRRIIKLKRHSQYKDFEIDQAPPKPDKLGVGPYVLMYKGREILRRPLHSNCRNELEKLGSEKWKIDREVRKKQKEFCEKWNLVNWPGSA